MKINNIILFMAGSRGVEVLEQLLIEDRHPTAIVVPEKDDFFNLISKKYSKENILKSGQINTFEMIETLEMLKADIFIVAGFPTIFKSKLLSLPKLGVINLHGGALPKYRGGSPLNWQIINDEKQIGISAILMDEGIDTGDILAEEFFLLEEQDTINSVHTKANLNFRKIISRVLNDLETNTLFVKKQNAKLAQYWLQRNEQDGFIDWNKVSARQVFNLIRALQPPYPSAFTYYNNEKIFLYEASIPLDIIKGIPGRVAYLQGKGPYIICNDHAILITKMSAKLENGIHLND